MEKLAPLVAIIFELDILPLLAVGFDFLRETKHWVGEVFRPPRILSHLGLLCDMNRLMNDEMVVQVGLAMNDIAVSEHNPSIPIYAELLSALLIDWRFFS